MNARNEHRQARNSALLIIAAAVVAMLFSSVADAQIVEAEATVKWTLPTHDTLGQPLEGENALQKVQLYIALAPIPDDPVTLVPIELPPVAESFAYENEVPNGSTLYFRLKACNDICSDMSEEAIKPVRVSVPNVPTGVTVTLRLNLKANAEVDSQ